MSGVRGLLGRSERGVGAQQASWVTPVDLRVSTAYAVHGDQTILVDSGPAGSHGRLLSKLRKAGVDPAGIGLIVLTHCHPDHAGGAAELSQQLGVPIAVHRDEEEWATSGRSMFYEAIRPFGRVLQVALRPDFPAFIPDLLLQHGDRLHERGAALTVLHTPGHTPGSITLLHRPVTGGAGGTATSRTAADSRAALMGDLLAGGMVRRDRPGMPFLAQDPARIVDSLLTVLAEAPGQLFFGHGKPASALSALRRFGPLPASVPRAVESAPGDAGEEPGQRTPPRRI